MATSSISNNYYTSQIYGLTSGANQNNETASNALKTALAAQRSGTGYTKTSSTTQSALLSTLSETLNAMGLGSNDSVRFNQILQYRNQIAAGFESKVKNDLKNLGVDEKVNFKLVMGEDGGIDVITDHEDKAKIEKYFKDNPDMVKLFQQIQSLTNVEEARKAQGIDVKSIRQRIQVESMTAWFANTGQNVSSIMDFSGGSTALMAGLNKVI